MPRIAGVDIPDNKRVDVSLTYIYGVGPKVSKDIIGFNLFINWNEPIVIVEGAFDAIAVKRNAIPLFGKVILDKLFEETASWPIDFHELILLRDVSPKEQLALKYDYERLSKIQHRRTSKTWQKSFNGKLFEKIFLETIKRIDSDKIYSPCKAGGRFVEIFPDGIVRGCEVEKLWDVSEIGSVNKTNLDIVDIVNSKKVPLVLNHTQGTPQTMQINPKYDDVLLDIYDFFEKKISFFAKKKFRKDFIIIDPGIGFGKNLNHNLRIMSKISIFHSLGCPILIGTSRKRFIEHIVTKFDTPDRTGGTLASVLNGLLQGVQLFRVHNVKEINQGILVFNKILNTN